MFRLISKRNCSTSSVPFYDVIVTGGGMVGAALSASLGASRYFEKKTVLMLEAGPSVAINRADRQNYSNRVSAINPSSRRLFESLGVWKLIEQARLKPVKQLKVWDSCSRSSIHFERENFNGDVAYIIENELIVDACVAALTEMKNVEIKTNAVVKNCRLPDDLSKLVELDLADGTKFRTALLIAADGANSLVRKTSGVHYVSWSYDQKAVVATLEVSTTGNNETAWQRFTPNGPIALLPLTDRLTSLVWTTTFKEADRLTTLPDDNFVDALNEALLTDDDQSSTTNRALEMLSNCVNLVSSPSTSDASQIPPTVVGVLNKSRASFPLGLGHATHYVRPRMALIGDAAHRVHPLAGQGVNLGFGDVATLTSILERAIANGADVGSMNYLADYESQRQRHNVPVMFTIDWLNRLYATKLFPFVFARSVGLNLVDRMEFVKKLIITEASA